MPHTPKVPCPKLPKYCAPDTQSIKTPNMMLQPMTLSWHGEDDRRLSMTFFAGHLFVCPHLSRLMTKPTKWSLSPVKTQRLRLAWASAQSDQSLCCALNTKLSSCGQRRLWSDLGHVQANLSLRWAHIPFCWLCHVAAHFVVSRFSAFPLGARRGLQYLIVTLPRYFSLVSFYLSMYYQQLLWWDTCGDQKSLLVIHGCK